MNKIAFNRSLLPAGCTVLCAVSGGADSVCLLDLARRLDGVTVLCAHFDHGIRGAESVRDAGFVRSLCEAWDIPFFLGRGDVPAYAAAHGESIETAARTLRYAFLRRTASEQGADRIATAHNLNDNAETVLFRLARGTGLRGLCGIPERRGDIVRPLLRTPRSAIDAYLAERGIPHVEDSTNAETDAARNRVRLSLLPELESIHPGAAGSISRMAETLAEDEAYLTSLAGDALSRWGDTLPCAELLALPRPVARRVLSLWLGGELSFERGNALLSFAGGAGGGTLELPGHRTVVRSFGRLAKGISRAERLPERVLPAEGTLVYPGLWEISSEICPAGAEIQISFNTFCFSYANICDKLTVASPADGDKIVLHRRAGTRSVRKLLAEESRVSAPLRESIPVIRDARGILAVYGVGQSERAFPGPEEPFIKITVRPTADEADEKEEDQYV